MIKELIPAEIHETPGSIRATVSETRQAASQAAEAMRSRNLRRIHLIGNGTSLFSSLAAAYTARMLAKASDPLVLAWPAGDFRYYQPALNEQDAIIGISASGEFRDVLAVFEQQAGKCLRVGVTHVPGSSISQVSDLLITSAGGLSRVPVMTKTYASTLTAAHLLLLEFFKAPKAWFDDLLQTADNIEQTLLQAEQRLPAIVTALKDYRHAFYFGAGPGFPAAMEGALKMKEIALLHAEGNETWEVASGAATVIGPETLCVVLDARGAGQPATRELASKVRQWGAPLLVLGPEQWAADYHLPVTLPGRESFASLALVPPAALFAYRMAQARGIDPNRPSWRDRYLSQGMTHIIGE